MAINRFRNIPDKILEMIRDKILEMESKVVFGTVITVDPLSIQLWNTDIVLPSKHFYLTDFVIAKKVKFRIHRIYGQPKQITFNGTAEEFIRNLTADNIKYDSESLEKKTTSESLKKSTNEQAETTLDDWGAPAPATGRFSSTAVGATPVIVSGQDFNTHIEMDWETVNPPTKEQTYTGSVENPVTESTDWEGDKDIPFPVTQTKEYIGDPDILPVSKNQEIEEPGLSFEINEQIDFHLEVLEEEEHVPENDVHRDQTTIAEGIIWRGLQVGDIVMMTSHDHAQNYLVHRIINRDRDQYEHAISWDSRLSDILPTNDIERHEPHTHWPYGENSQP